jgi:hypothetical protein
MPAVKTFAARQQMQKHVPTDCAQSVITSTLYWLYLKEMTRMMFQKGKSMGFAVSAIVIIV